MILSDIIQLDSTQIRRVLQQFQIKTGPRKSRTALLKLLLNKIESGDVQIRKPQTYKASRKTKAQKFQDRLRSAAYKRTKVGRINVTYQAMKQRCLNSSHQNFHKYEGKLNITQEEFKQWALSEPGYHKVYRDWAENGYSKQLTPSIDRIDNTRGYELGNIQYLPFIENCRKQ